MDQETLDQLKALFDRSQSGTWSDTDHKRYLNRVEDAGISIELGNDYAYQERGIWKADEYLDDWYVEKKFNDKIFRYEESEILNNKDSFLEKIYTKSFFEDQKLGTIGPLSLIKKEISSSIIVMNSDLITTLSIPAMVSFHKSEKLDASIAAALFETEIPYGVLKYNEIGKLNSIEEKPKIKNLIAAGVYILNKNVINMLKKNIPLDMPKLIDKAIENKLNIGVFPIHETWKDIGRPNDYYNMKKNL